MTEPSIRIQYVLAIAQALVAFGGAATLPEVYAWITDNGLRRPQTPPTGMDAEDHYRREVRFARQELAEGGLLVTLGDHWRIANEERLLALTPEAVREMIRQNRRNRDAKGQAGGRRSSRPSTPSTGPPPTEWFGEVTRVCGPATTYALRFGDTDLFKIGYASDPRSRLSAVNRHVPIEIVGSSWTLARSRSWPGQLAAYAMEQAVLAILTPERTVFERVRCSPERLAAAWDQAAATVAKQWSALEKRAGGESGISTRVRPKA